MSSDDPFAQALEKAQDALDKPVFTEGLPKRDHPDSVRAQITRWVVAFYLLYLAGLGVSVVLIHVDGYSVLTPEQVSSGSEIAKTFLTPLVLLVIGYYFGSAKRD